MSKISEYKESIQIYSLSSTVDEAGGVITSNTLLGTYYAKVDDYRGNQDSIEDRDTTANMYLVELRYDAAVLQGMKIVLDGVTLFIREIVVDTVINKKKMKLKCSSLQ